MGPVFIGSFFGGIISLISICVHLVKKELMIQVPAWYQYNNYLKSIFKYIYIYYNYWANYWNNIFYKYLYFDMINII